MGFPEDALEPVRSALAESSLGLLVGENDA
jgi:hypothetical protein